MKIKIVVFDLDGVVFDSWPATLAMTKKLKKELGQEFDEELLVRTWAFAGHSWVESLFPDNDPQEIVRWWVREELSSRIELVPASSYVFWWLKLWDFKTGIITNRRAGKLLNKILEDNRLDLARNFDFVQTVKANAPFSGVYDNTRIHRNHFISAVTKPHPDSFFFIRRFLRKRGLGEENVLFVGDTIGADLTLARRVGIEFLGVMTGPIDTREKWLELGGLDGRHVLKSIIELPRWLSRRQREELTSGR